MSSLRPGSDSGQACDRPMFSPPYDVFVFVVLHKCLIPTLSVVYKCLVIIATSTYLVRAPESYSLSPRSSLFDRYSWTETSEVVTSEIL